jgi:hypothetical protein
VSCTVTFDPDTEGVQIAPALDLFQYQLKGVSLLPRAPKSAYKQLPYEAINEATYHAEVSDELQRYAAVYVCGDVDIPTKIVLLLFCRLPASGK